MPSDDPLILFYTTFFGKPVDITSIQCTMPGRWTLDKRRISEAAAMVFHLPDFREIGDAYKYPGQYWVAWSMECGQNYQRVTAPEFMRHFDITMTHETGSDVWTPYLPPAQWWKDTLAKTIMPKTEEAPVALFQSAGTNASKRIDLATELARHIRIDSYGRYFNNRSVAGPDLGPQTKIETIARHKFCFAMENAIEADYVTEKIYDAFLAGTVPIYLGAPNVDEFVPRNSYVDASAFGSARELAVYLQHLIETPQEYEAYFAWRSKPLPDNLVERMQILETPARCRLMTLVGQRLGERPYQPSGRRTLPFGYMSYLRTKLRRWQKKVPR
ncbi:alpha-1,3-fucosyltransferase [Mesorhizobium sp. WSM4303]|uniref:glycosyltransferase family 10 domain-containing protein n=1 Tax=unclassified Mesorhizobium TaxID=325217 RepID=UPI00115D89AF|nr:MULTISPECIES: glycosyltransferase family 10 [unclassified Mesorhizobium]TRC96758.1 alpha-1,3-fucosyltransferase [Mesorhizobium sp. WSM4306]TRD08433.1 alpha-1,3-fucosyltransferase [Mesorhizobium sp. WSM4303]